MANDTTVKSLAGFLDENGLQYDLQLDEERILLGIDGVPMMVRYRAEAAVLLITVPNVLRAPQEGHGAPSSEALNTFLRYIMDANYKLMVGRFGWDHRDGEVIFEIAVLCTDAPITRDQFMANLVLAVQTVEKRYPDLQRALWSGLSLEQLLQGDDEVRGPMLPGTGRA
ncbi:MAG TPA: YbjN domain-containing protein [Chloroflexota bacterium]|nr:YbjN domain-containing protein [Chloroflexota bacterium]